MNIRYTYFSNEQKITCAGDFKKKLISSKNQRSARSNNFMVRSYKVVCSI